MNPNPDDAQARLRAASRTKDHARRSAWLLLVIGASLLVLLAVALADYWLLLPLGWRVASALVLVGVVAVGLARFIKLLRRPTSFKEAALDVEAQDPKLGCTVSTAAEYLSGERPVTQEYEPQLVAALEAQAARALAQAKVPYWRRLLAPSVLMAVGCVLLLAFLLAATGAGTALYRTAAPWSSAAYTQVEVQPGNVEIPVGKDVDIRTIFRGRPPKDARFHWRSEADPKWHYAILTKAEQEQAYVYPLKGLRQALTYRVTGSDATSPDFSVDTYVPPEIKELRIRLAYPAYVDRPAIEQTSPNITIVRGSTASFQVAPTVELASAKLRLGTNASIDLVRGQDNGWTAHAPILKDTDYWIELRDAKGHLGVNETPYHIKALPDEPPKVEITDPGQDLRADATNTIPLKLSVADDFGVGDIRLVYHRLGGPEQVVQVQRTTVRGKEIQASVDLPLEPLGLKEYELVAFHAEAVDNNTLDGPGIGKSPLYFVEITNEEGSNCKPKSQGSKVNLLVIQKQLIADTQALAKDSPAEKFGELAAREKEAMDYGKLYQDSMTGGGAPPAALALMQSAMQDMKGATAALEAKNRGTALPPEESALANFYQILKLVPELQDLPTQSAATNRPPAQEEQESPMVKVVLEAIKKQRKEQPDNKQLAELTDQLQQLARSQAALNQASQNSGKNDSALSRAGKDAQSTEAQKESAQAKNDQSKEGQQANGQQGQKGQQGRGKDGQQDQQAKQGQQGKEGQGQQGQQGQQANGQQGQQGQPGQRGAPGQGDGWGLAQTAEKQQELKDAAVALAKQLAALAAKDGRLGQNLMKTMGNALNRMKAALDNWQQANPGEALAQGEQSVFDLNTVVSMLEKILEADKKLADISSEDYPVEYEAAIRDYLKRLSYEE